MRTSAMEENYNNEKVKSVAVVDDEAKIVFILCLFRSYSVTCKTRFYRHRKLRFCKLS